jgi:CubicO group peptidase (beta-lactamase class C family)
LQFRYSGGGTTIVQQLMIDVLKMPFPEIMRTLVLDPLGMAGSTYEQPLPAHRAASAATGHPENGIPLIGRYHTYPEMAAAGLWTTPADLAKAGAALMSTLNSLASPGFLRPETLEAMLQPQLPGQQAGADEYCGLGFFCHGKGEGAFFGHAGGDAGFVAITHFYRQAGKSAVVMINSNVGHALLFEVLRAIAREYAWPDFLPTPKTVVETADPQKYVGAYATPEGLTFTVVRHDGGVALQYARQSPLPLLASSELEFFATGLNVGVTFEKGDAGRMSALTVLQEGRPIKASKV